MWTKEKGLCRGSGRPHLVLRGGPPSSCIPSGRFPSSLLPGSELPHVALHPSEAWPSGTPVPTQPGLECPHGHWGLAGACAGRSAAMLRPYSLGILRESRI